MNELSKNLQCIVLNGNIERWLESEKADMVRMALKRGDKFVEIGGEIMNTFSIVGVFNAATMEERIRRRNGEWQCEHGKWWEKGDKKCHCVSNDIIEKQKAVAEATRRKYGITD